ncbi:uncharacterized protein EV420DRAFT_1712746 [Desarmillaria tabescens]|uniref:F-box domain-containing protein n=1 Tax=Armillaria tabescens TaxID=1929756 RepID=A0AA39JS78_ARMTA|nr:uncharacterized protein EV420DRAFT_1712746 [Desarmillaria tabescens]KAK0447848.1 hypothetical protein EV420DRAFT_1712746 [Desarmillaria tabescens]
MQTFHVPLEEILAKYNWILTFTHPPDVASLLRINEAPSPILSARLKTSLADLTTSLADLQSDLDLLRNAVVSLETRMSRLQSIKQDYKKALSPIRRIPSEVLAEILCRSWSWKDNMSIMKRHHRHALDVFTTPDGPWFLGQLWATLNVDIPASHKKVMKADAMDILHVILERSRNHPLKFQLYYYDLKVEGANLKAIERCFDLLISHSTRWRDVRMTIPPSLLPRLSPIRGKIDLLREIYFICHRDPQPKDSDIRALEIAPKLEHLHMYGMHPGISIHFSPTNLVSFSDARPFAGDQLTPKYLDVVKTAPRLSSFSCTDYAVNLISTLSSFPCVVSSSIEELSTSSPSCMLGMKLPSLKKVTQLVIEFYEWVDDYDPIMQYLVTQMSEVDGSLKHFVVPSLQDFGVYVHSVDYTNISFINPALVDMVASRLRQPSEAPCLTKLGLWVMGQGWSCDLDETAENALKSLQNEGLELNYRLDDVEIYQ